MAATKKANPRKRKPEPPPSALESAFNEVHKRLKKESKVDIVLFEAPIKDEKKQKPGDVTSEYLLSLKHILLPKDVHRAALKIDNDINQLCHSWRQGNTSLGDEIWRAHMMPKLKLAQKRIQEEKWKAAFGIMFGMHLYVSSDSLWIMDQEVYYCEFAKFSAWFRKYSEAWKLLLARSDEELGLCGQPCGRTDGFYRTVLEEQLQSWQVETNKDLLNFDEHAEDNELPRIRIVSDAQTKKQKHMKRA